MRERDWIIFYNDATGRIGCVPVGSMAASAADGTTIKGFHGTENEAIQEAMRLATGKYKELMRFYPKKQYIRKKKAGAATPTQ